MQELNNIEREINLQEHVQQIVVEEEGEESSERSRKHLSMLFGAEERRSDSEAEDIGYQAVMGNKYSQEH